MQTACQTRAHGALILSEGTRRCIGEPYQARVASACIRPTEYVRFEYQTVPSSWRITASIIDTQAGKFFFYVTLISFRAHEAQGHIWLYVHHPRVLGPSIANVINQIDNDGNVKHEHRYLCPTRMPVDLVNLNWHQRARQNHSQPLRPAFAQPQPHPLG